MSIDQIKSNMRSTWMAGDFGIVAKTISGAAEDFVARLALPAGTRVLDIATGTGNLAIPLARSGCIVTGVDIHGFWTLVWATVIVWVANLILDALIGTWRLERGRAAPGR